MDKVVYLHPKPEPIGHYLRVGPSGHRQLELLIDSGRMPLDRLVIDGAAAHQQRDLLGLIKGGGGELLLDTNVAELSSIGRYDGVAKNAPWANPDGPLSPQHFAKNSNHDVIGRIARFAVEQGFHVVQAPTHFLDGSTDPWFPIDRDSCLALRHALDAEGGRDISIDYSLMTKYASIRDSAQRRAFVNGLSDLPFENLWLRISGFGSDATPMGSRRYISIIMDFQSLGRPIIADGIGGLVGLGVLAFGAAGGICHGAAEKERFDASDWGKPRSEGGGGKEKRVLVPGLDRLLSVKQTNNLMTATGARRLLSCNDRSCCPNGLEDTFKNPKAHYLRQRANQVRHLSSVPESRRVEEFLNNHLSKADRTARLAAKLKVNDEALKTLLTNASERLHKMQAVLEDLHKTIGNADRALTPYRRPRPPKTVAYQNR